MAFVASSNSAFRIVENPDLLNLIAYVSNQQAKIPTTKTLVSDLDIYFQKIIVNLKQIINSTKFVCTTADIWTKKSISFMGVTIHYLDENLERKSYLLAFRRMFGRHTHAAIAELLMSINREFNIHRNKVTNIITDGASNFKKAFVVFGSDVNKRDSNVRAGIYEENAEQNDDENAEQNNDDKELDVEEVLGPESDEMFYPPDVESVDLQWTSNFDDDEDEFFDYGSLPAQLRCISHSFNLLGSDFEKKLKELLPKCFEIYNNSYRKLKRFWEVNSRSTVAHEIIQNICKRSFPYPSTVRWNGQFDAVEIAEKHKQSINTAIENINRETKQHLPKAKKSKQLEVISSAEWKILKDYTICMRPIAIALDIIQGEKRACAGYVLPTLYGVKASLVENTENKLFVSDYGKLMNETMLKCFEKRFGDLMKICDENRHLILAAAIHPNFKLTWLESEGDREFAQTLLINSYVELASSIKRRTDLLSDSSQVSESPPRKKSQESQFFKRLRAGEKRTSTEDSLTFDVWKYLLQTIDDPNLSQIRGYPILEQLFRQYNTSLASSAAVERIFSQALIVFTPRRNKISNGNFEKVLFVNRNRELL